MTDPNTPKTGLIGYIAQTYNAAYNIPTIDPMTDQLAAHHRRIQELSEPPISYAVVGKDPEPEGSAQFVYRTVGVDFTTREVAEEWKAGADEYLPHDAWPGRTYIVAEVRAL